ncbi:MAG: 5'-nucleotidase C-terminal domain-containing protein [Acidimicrobiales bacterium]
MVAYDGAELASIESVIAATPELLVISPDEAAQAILDSYSEQVDILKGTVIGTATENLCLARIPQNAGQTKIPDCVTEGIPHGGDIQQLVTYAFADRAFDADIALQNSGGVRVDVTPGDYTVADAYSLLPFANTIYNLEMTGTEIKASLEEGLGNILDAGGSSGAYPYAAYLRWDVDMTAAAGSRFSNLEFREKGTDTWVPFDMNRTYTVAANSFMASGGDGYATLKAVVADGRGVDTYIDYAQGFIDYIEQDLAGTIARVPVTDYSTQGFTPPAG